MTKRVLNLPVAVSPELVGKRHRHGSARCNRSLVYRIGFRNLQVKHDGRAAESLRGGTLAATVFRKIVAEHQRRPVDQQRGVHNPLAVGWCMPRKLLRAESFLVKIDRGSGVADENMG